MSVYPGRKEVQEWVEWVRKYLPSDGDIPSIDWCGPEAKTEPGTNTAPECGEAAGNELPWVGASQDILDEEALAGSASQRENMLALFAEVMSADVRELAPRFAALHFYYNLGSADWPEYSIYKEYEYGSTQAGFRRDLRVLVGMLQLEECPHDWRRLKWEISNSLAAEDWDRAHQLYSFAEAFNAAEAKDIWALRGQVSFFVALGRDKEKRRETYDWLLSVNPPGNGLGSYFVSRAYWSALVEAPAKLREGTLDDKTRGLVLDARSNLEKAFQSRADLGPVYHAMLGTCYLALGDYVQAPREYNKVLSLEVRFKHVDFDVLLRLLRKVKARVGDDVVDLLKRISEEHAESFIDDFKPPLFRVLADSCARGGKPSEAEAVYGEWAQEYPNDPRVYKDLAGLLAQQQRFREATEALRKLVDLQPETEQEPAYRVALALGSIAPDQIDIERVTREIFENKPEVTKLLDLLFRDLWPTYGRLGNEAREALLYAACLTYYLASIQPALAPQLAQTGGEKHAKAVEIELRERVFVWFRKVVSRDSTLKAVAVHLCEDKTAGPFARFLVRNGRLTLGQMHFILTQAVPGNGELFARFGKWVSENFLGLTRNKLDGLPKICRPRNLEAHKQLRLEVKDVPRLCREFLDALLAGPPPSQM
ncbi:MAG: hypothetical protein LAP13_05245 [Acidobacteriia bacterium]|nr:hypothetical protein [Terriglobia bacterium]